jgi:hypothetical protein
MSSSPAIGAAHRQIRCAGAGPTYGRADLDKRPPPTPVIACTAAVFVLLLSPCVSSAQEGGVTATLRGTVHDASGAALPGAQVTLTNTGTKALQTLTADGISTTGATRR